MNDTKFKLTKRQVRQWVNSLRSGKYKQGYFYLCSDVGDKHTEDLAYCCLGVACDLFIEADWDIRTNGSANLIAKDSRIYTVMPPVFLQNAIDSALGASDGGQTPSCNEVFEGKVPCEKLAEMNDKKMSFEEIASAIEKAAGL